MPFFCISSNVDSGRSQRMYVINVSTSLSPNRNRFDESIIYCYHDISRNICPRDSKFGIWVTFSLNWTHYNFFYIFSIFNLGCSLRIAIEISMIIYIYIIRRLCFYIFDLASIHDGIGEVISTEHSLSVNSVKLNIDEHLRPLIQQ